MKVHHLLLSAVAIAMILAVAFQVRNDPVTAHTGGSLNALNTQVATLNTQVARLQTQNERQGSKLNRQSTQIASLDSGDVQFGYVVNLECDSQSSNAWTYNLNGCEIQEIP